MALAALELGKRTPRSTINDPGYFIFGDRRFRDSKPGGHGVVDLYKSIVVSSDTYYYMLANDMGIDNIAGFMKHFGFGARTGIDLEGEAAGVLPSPEWKMKRFRRPEQQKWYRGRDHLDRHRPGLQRVHADRSWRRRWRRSPTTASCTGRTW